MDAQPFESKEPVARNAPAFDRRTTHYDNSYTCKDNEHTLQTKVCNRTHDAIHTCVKCEHQEISSLVTVDVDLSKVSYEAPR